MTAPTLPAQRQEQPNDRFREIAEALGYEEAALESTSQDEPKDEESVR